MIDRAVQQLTGY